MLSGIIQSQGVGNTVEASELNLLDQINIDPSSGNEVSTLRFNTGNVSHYFKLDAYAPAVGGSDDSRNIKILSHATATGITMTASGKVGIGTTSPSPHKLYVASGDIGLEPTQKLIFDAASGNSTYITEGANDIMRFVAGGTQGLEVKGTDVIIPTDLTVDTDTLKVVGSTNRVGIGTASPDKPLHIVGETRIEEGDLRFVKTGDANIDVERVDGIPDLKIGGGSAQEGGTMMRDVIFNNTDNVGIGGVPSEKFHVVGGDIMIDSGRGLRGSGGQEQYQISTADVGSLRLRAGGSEVMRISGDGNVGIGTDDPDGNLHIGDGTGIVDLILDKAGNGTTTIDFYNAGNVKGELRFTDGEALLWRNAGVDLFTILENGNVGIGTTEPSKILHVNGESLFTGTMFAPEIRQSAGNVKVTSNNGDVIITTDNDSPTDSDLGSGSIVMYLDEGGDNLKFRVKYSDTTLKTGTISLT